MQGPWDGPQQHFTAELQASGDPLAALYHFVRFGGTRALLQREGLEFSVPLKSKTTATFHGHLLESFNAKRRRRKLTESIRNTGVGLEVVPVDFLSISASNSVFRSACLPALLCHAPLKCRALCALPVGETPIQRRLTARLGPVASRARPGETRRDGSSIWGMAMGGRWGSLLARVHLDQT